MFILTFPQVYELCCQLPAHRTPIPHVNLTLMLDYIATLITYAEVSTRYAYHVLRSHVAHYTVFGLIWVDRILQACYCIDCGLVDLIAVESLILRNVEYLSDYF